MIKGSAGESAVHRVLSTLPCDRYFVYNDILLPNKNDTAQIDHIVVSIYGIFVIETKSYNGWIYGNDESEFWTQNLYGKKYNFKNPIKQNYGHVKTIEDLLSFYKGVKVVPIIAFSPESVLKTNVKSCPVVYYPDIPFIIYQYKDFIIDFKEISNIINLIMLYNIRSKEGRIKHVQYAKSTANAVYEKIHFGICPRCGSQLINRTGEYGEYVGCSNYPKCRFTVK